MNAAHSLAAVRSRNRAPHSACQGTARLLLAPTPLSGQKTGERGEFRIPPERPYSGASNRVARPGGGVHAGWPVQGRPFSRRREHNDLPGRFTVGRAISVESGGRAADLQARKKGRKNAWRLSKGERARRVAMKRQHIVPLAGVRTSRGWEARDPHSRNPMPVRAQFLLAPLPNLWQGIRYTPTHPYLTRRVNRIR